jgi:flagellar hook-associated protein 1 FlgK
MISSSSTLAAYSRVLDVIQNNVANASTPGYAKQRVDLYALTAQDLGGTNGGVNAGEVQSSRNEYAEQSVRTQTSGLGYQQQLQDSLTVIQSNFDVSGNQGIPKALNELLQSFSAWGAAPDDQSARQTVLERADAFAQAMQQASKSIAGTARDTSEQITSTVDQINQKVAEIQGYNEIVLKGNTNDAGLSARMHAALEELSSLADVRAVFQSDGSVNLSLNGQTPLLIGDQQEVLSVALQPVADTTPYPSGLAAMCLQAADGSRTSTSGGQLGALLNVRNQIVPSLVGDGSQIGDLNQMALSVAQRVNNILTTGVVDNGPPPVSGVPLFTYDSGNPTSVAASLAIDPSVGPDQLAAIQPGPPAVSNGVPITLSALASPIEDADKISGYSYSQFYGQVAGRVGGLLNDAQNNTEVQQSLVSQAKDMRQRYQGVSLDEEAALLMQFQRAYQANARFLTVIDQLTQSVIDLLQV